MFLPDQSVSSRTAESSSSSSCIPPQQRQAGDEQGEVSREERPRVRFDSHATLVLIPSREEFHSAKCDLWWKGMDFFCFQRKACSEIHLLSLLQGISMNEAKRRLYQPDPKHANCWDFVVTDATPPSSAQNTPEPPRGRKSLSPSPSLSPAAVPSSANTAASAAVSTRKSAEPRHLDIESRAAPSPSLSLSHSRAQPADDDDAALARERESIAHLHFCVPLTERVPVVERECRPAAKNKKKRRGGSGGDASSAAASTLLALLLFFALCVVGYRVARAHTAAHAVVPVFPASAL